MVKFVGKDVPVKFYDHAEQTLSTIDTVTPQNHEEEVYIELQQ